MAPSRALGYGHSMHMTTEDTPCNGLQTRNIGKHFGGIYAVSDVSIEVHDNEVVGLIGPNGAGKTSLMNVISGVLSIDEGDILIDGTGIAGQPIAQCAWMGIARTFQNIRVFANLTVDQNIQVALTTAKRHRKSSVGSFAINDFLSLLDLEEVADQKAGTLPYGTQRRLEIARALALFPRVLLLDEPAAGMNENETQSLMHTIRDLHEQFTFGILVIDHDLRFIMNLCERIYVMDTGRIIAHGTPAEIQSNQIVREVYLGGNHKQPKAAGGS